MNCFILVISVIYLLILWVIYYKYNRDEKPIKKFEYYIIKFGKCKP